MEESIRKLFLKDCAAILSTTIVLWAVLAFALAKLRCIAPDPIISGLIVAAGIIAGIFATTAAIAVVFHLVQNNNQAYEPELSGRNGS
jgi:hypothetical protein